MSCDRPLAATHVRSVASPSSVSTLPWEMIRNISADHRAAAAQPPAASVAIYPRTVQMAECDNIRLCGKIENGKER